MKNTSAREIMSSNLDTVTPSHPIIEVKRIYEKSEFHRHIPVIEDDCLVGMVSLSDFMYKIGDAGFEDSDPVYRSVFVRDIMTPDPESLDVSAKIIDVMKILARGDFHSVPLLDGKRLAGIVTTTDVIKYFLKKA